MQVYVATMETRNFTFTAVGEDEAQARAGIEEAWRVHCEQHARADKNYIDDCDITVLAMHVGSAYRDGEAIAHVGVALPLLLSLPSVVD